MENYSVLMSVYYNEKPEYFSQAMQSIYNQTVPTNDFVLVCDGILTDELNTVISEMQSLYGNILNVIRLNKNGGLGNALNVGLKYCKNELVARMDSDDIALPERCEKELNMFLKIPQLDAISGTVEEFCGDVENIIGKRSVPNKLEEIVKFSRTRNPLNHPAVMFRKSKVILAGGYRETFHFFEDYDLWIRMLMGNCIMMNLNDTILKMRVSNDIYIRRGGYAYAKTLLRFHYWLLSLKWESVFEFVFVAIPHAAICVLPNTVRKKIYMSIR